MSVDTAAIRLMLLERHQNDGLSNSSYIELRHLTYEFDELRSQLAEQHQQLVLAEVARDASRDAYDATKRELDTLRARLESAEGALRQWTTTTRELAAAKAQVAELTRWKREANAAVDSLKTAVEALEWCEQAGFTILHEQVRNIARKALAAIRAPETQPECTCRHDDPDCPVHGLEATLHATSSGSGKSPGGVG